MNTLNTLPLELPNAEEYPEAFADMMDEPVMITEFLYGRDWAVTASRHAVDPKSAIVTVVQFGNQIRAIEDERAYNEGGFDYMLRSIMATAPQEVETITLRGVFTYPDYYARSGSRGAVWLYDIELNGEPMDARHVFQIFSAFVVPHVPLLSAPGETLYGWMNRRPIPDAAEGWSKLAPIQRRGIVVRPTEEKTHPSVGRLLLKALPRK